MVTKKNEPFKAKILSEQYSSVFKRDTKKRMPPISGPRYRSMPRIKISVNGVETLLKKLNPKKAVGPDRVPTNLLKDHADIMSPVLQVIFQQSLDTGIVPSDWKQANVVAVFKIGDKNAAANYRPVSLTCILCKVLESFITEAVLDHVISQQLLAKEQ